MDLTSLSTDFPFCLEFGENEKKYLYRRGFEKCPHAGWSPLEKLLLHLTLMIIYSQQTMHACTKQDNIYGNIRDDVSQRCSEKYLFSDISETNNDDS